MASSVPFFINKSIDYKDIFGDDDKEPTPIEATPISKIKNASASQEKSSTSSKRKLPTMPTESVKAPNSRLAKKTKQTLVHDDSSPGPKAQLFANMIGNQIPEKTIAECDKMNLTDAAKAIPLANAQSFFHYLKHGEEIVEAARGDQRMAQELQQLKVLIKTKDDEKKKLIEAGKNIRASEIKLSKEREQLNATIIKLDAEKEEMTTSHAKQIHELELKIDTLYSTIATERSAHKKDMKDKFLAGYNNGIKDYFRSTYEKFPDVDWAQLGDDVAAMVKEFQEKTAKGVQKEAEHAAPTQETLVPGGEVNAEVQMEEPKSAEPVLDQVTPETVSEAPAP